MMPLRVVNDVAVVTATADYDPLHKLSKLEAELSEFSFEGTVLFDLLCINGLCENRFIEIAFNGDKFNRTSYKVRASVDDHLLKSQDKFFTLNPHILNFSVLSAKEVKNFRDHNI